jgi:hypothetical protein
MVSEVRSSFFIKLIKVKLSTKAKKPSDASNLCIEGVLEQRNDNGILQSIGLVSRMLKGAES